MSSVTKGELLQRDPGATRRVYLPWIAMPKKPRYELPPGFVHVTARGNRQAEIFFGERDARQFEVCLDDAVRRSDAVCHALCLMPNHFHLLLHVAAIEELSACMQRLNGMYAQWFNRKYGLNGHLFQGPYDAAAIETDAHALEAIRYILLNPVRANLCACPAAWPWSSYRAIAGDAPAPRYLTTSWVLRMFHRERARARDRFAVFVADGLLTRTAMSRDLARGRSRRAASPPLPRALPSAA
jgi:putative transposase